MLACLFFCAFDCPFGCLFGCVHGCLVVWLVACMVVWLFVRLVVCLVLGWFSDDVLGVSRRILKGVSLMVNGSCNYVFGYIFQYFL